MFVGDVYSARSPSAFTLSEGSPVPSSVIASNDRHVSAAYRCMVCLGVCAAAGAARASASASATVSRRIRCMVRPFRSALEAGHGDALGEVALQGQEDGDHGHHED